MKKTFFVTLFTLFSLSALAVDVDFKGRVTGVNHEKNTIEVTDHNTKNSKMFHVTPRTDIEIKFKEKNKFDKRGNFSDIKENDLVKVEYEKYERKSSEKKKKEHKVPAAEEIKIYR